MITKFDVYGRKYNEWFYVDTFTNKEAALEGIYRLLADSQRLKSFAKYVEYKIQETYTWA
jgi:hypothetical protein